VKKMMLRIKFQALMVMLLAVVVLSGCSASAPMTDEAAGTSEETMIEQPMVEEVIEEEMMDSGDEAEFEVRIVEVEAGSFYYEPNEIRVRQGETVRIVMTSVDMMHDFTIDELGVNIPVTKNGETAEVEFTADTLGEFEFYCSVGEHRANGQVGTLIVEE
jgi:heme/copper-type cytochrome/quinol oxidase subunit 2